MIFFFQAFFAIIIPLLSFFVAYLLLLTFAALFADRETAGINMDPKVSFLILIPAHNEERLLPSALKSLSHLEYPSSLYSIHIVADNCNDRTAAVARMEGAIVHERSEKTRMGKGYALQWLLNEIWQANETFDAVCIVDADTVVSSNFLRVMSARIDRGQRVIQAYYDVRDPSRSWSGNLRYAALAVLHYLRPQGRSVLGGSAGLKGNGMVFSSDVLEQNEWSASITEDIDFHMKLLLNGERVYFAPDAHVWGEMPDSLSDSESQHMRWEAGRIQMALKYVPQLGLAGWKSLRDGSLKQAYRYFDALMEHIIPPFSLLVALTLFSLFASLLLFAFAKIPGLHFLLGESSFLQLTVLGSTLMGIAIFIGEMIYLALGLYMVGAPLSVYKAFIYAPVLMLWKIWQYFKAIIVKDKQSWIRTVRNEG